MDSTLHACEGVRLGLTSPDVMAGARNVPECSLCSPVGFARQERIVCMIKLFLITMMRKNLLCIREKQVAKQYLCLNVPN
jgi:hypothetical protein